MSVQANQGGVIRTHSLSFYLLQQLTKRSYQNAPQKVKFVWLESEFTLVHWLSMAKPWILTGPKQDYGNLDRDFLLIFRETICALQWRDILSVDGF